MPKKVSRDQRKSDASSRLSIPKKRPNPMKSPKDEVRTSSASAKKIRLSDSSHTALDPHMHYRVIDFLLVFTTISSIVKCKDCGGEVEFVSHREEGLGFEIQVRCDKCKPRNIFSSEKTGRRFEVNLRFIFIMRTLGLGLAGCNKFCGLMDLTKNFLSKATFNSYTKSICTIARDATSEILKRAVKKEREATCEENKLDDTMDLTVSGDGTWMKRGFSSLYGVTSLIGYYTGKVVDLLVKSSHCQLCKSKEHCLNTVEFEEWFETHIEEGECNANHVGPAGNMEVEAMKEMFLRSEETYGGVRYVNYIGDGDSKTFTGIVNLQPYGDDCAITKKECVGHVQKRMGTRLRELVKSTTEEKVVKSGKNIGKKIKHKTLSGKGKLTAKIIDKLTVYYGLAIRRNCLGENAIANMKNAIWATYHHYASTDEKPQHDKCPIGEESWCKYQVAAATNGLQDFRHDYSPLSSDVLAAIKPIYEDLSKEELLTRCVGGFTQNNNESYNQLIWRIAPKISSGSAELVEVAANIAACTFNDGSCALLQMMDLMGISLGRSAHEYARLTDETRIKRADHEAKAQSKEARVLRRQKQKDTLDIAEAAGTLLYGAGIDDSM